MHKGILLRLALAVVLPLTAQESNHLAPAAATHAENIAPQQTDAVQPRPEGSIYMGGFRAPKIFPDFTRGDWKTTEPLGIVD